MLGIKSELKGLRLIGGKLYGSLKLFLVVLLSLVGNREQIVYKSEINKERTSTSS